MPYNKKLSSISFRQNGVQRGEKRMKHIWDWFRKQLFYGGLERDQYRRISGEINEVNRKSLVMISAFCMLIDLTRLCISFGNIPRVNQIAFSLSVVLFGALALINPKRTWTTARASLCLRRQTSAQSGVDQHARQRDQVYAVRRKRWSAWRKRNPAILI